MSKDKGDITENLKSSDNKENDKKKKKRIIIAIVSALLIALLIVGLFIYRDQFMAITMRIQRLVGTVNLYNEGHEQELREKMRLGAGQTVETAGESLIMVSLDDTKLMTMEESSKADIKARGKKLEFDLIEGNLFFNVTEKLKKRESFDIHTSTMICGIRGTSAYVGRDSTRHETLMVTDGVVSVDATNPVTKETIHVDVYAGEKITIFLDEEAEGDATISIKKEKFREEDLPSLALDAIRKSPELQKRIAKATGFSTERLVALADATSKSGISMYGSAAEKLSADGIKDAIPIMGYNAQIMVRTANRAVDTAGDDLPLEIAIIKGLNGTMNSGIEAGYEGEPLGIFVDSAADCLEACIKGGRSAGLGNDDLVTVTDSVSGALQTSVGEMAKANLSTSEITQVVSAIGTVYTEVITSSAETGTANSATNSATNSGSEGPVTSTDKISNILKAVGNASEFVKTTVDSEMLKKSTGEETAAELLRKARATESKAEESQTKADKTRQTAGNTDASANSQNTTANAPSATSSVNTQSSASAGTESTGTATSAQSLVTSSSSNSGGGSSSGSGNSGSNSGGNQSGGNSGSAPAVYGDMTIAGGITGGSVSTPLAAGSAPAQGETVTLNIAPNTGHSLTSLTVNTVDDNGNVTGSVNTTEVTPGSQYTFVMPAEKTVVNASFNPNTYNVNLNLNGATVTGGNITQYTYGTAVALPTQVTKASTPEFDYSFTGWTDAPTGGNPVTGITATDINDKNFYPQFSQTRRSYAVTKNTGVLNGSISVKVGTAEVTQAENSGTVTVTVTPDTGYRLDTLTYTPTGGNATAITATNGVYSFIMPTEDVTVNATFTQIAYNLTATFDSNKGNVRFKVGGNTVTTAHYGDVVVIELTPDTGYVSTRPSVNNGAVMEAYIDANTYRFDMPASDATVTEAFDNASYTVSLDTHGGTINSGNVTSYTYGTGATLPTNVTKVSTATTNYAFAGWFTEATGGTQVTAISPTDTGIKTYHAHWTETARTYSVTLNTGGGTIGAGNVTSYTCGIGATLPTNVTKTATATTAYSFRGWFTAATGGTQVTSISTTDTGDKEFYAQWDESAVEYNITTNSYSNGTLNIHIKNTTGAITQAANGATVVIDATPNTHYRLRSLYVRLPGHIDNYATVASGANSLEFTMPTDNVNVYAEFELDTYTINVTNYSGGGYSISSPTVGSFSITSGTALVGETVTVTMNRSTGRGKNTLEVAGQSVVMDLSDDDSTYTYQFTMPANSVGITMGSRDMSAHFSISAGATITNGSASLNTERLPDRTIELTVTPNTGYELDTLTVTKVMPTNVHVGTGYSTTVPVTLKSGTNNVYTFTMPPMDVNYNVTFKPATYGITYEPEGGTINDLTYATSYVYGTGTSSLPHNVTKTQTAQYTYSFVGWFTAATGGTQVTSISTTDNGAKTLYAHWTQTPRSYTVTKSATTNGTIAVKVGTTEVTSAANGATVTVVPSPATGYELDTLTYTPAGGSATTITATNGVYSFVMPTSNVTVTATFRTANSSTGIYWSINNAGTVLSFYNTAGTGRTAVAADADLYGGAPWEMNNVGDDITTIVFEDIIRPTSLRGWFQCLRNLTTLVNMQNLDTSNVTTMYKMFFSDDSLTELDLSYFDTSNVTDMDWMFESCEHLETIYASDSFVTTGLSDLDNGMFYNCENIIGGAGSSSYSCGNSAERAHIDGGTNNPGYFTRKNSASSGTTSTMLVNSTNSNNAGFRAMMDSDYNGETLKYLVKTFSKSATAPSSSQDDYNIASNDSDRPVYLWYEPSTQALKWYSEAETVYLESDISLMFSFYQAGDEAILETVDFTGLNMSRVTDICNLFEECLTLTSVTWGGGDRASIESASNAFSSTAITEIDLSPFTFENCDLFDGMFWACDSLEKIYVDNGVRINSNPSVSNDMFWGCDSLVGGNHTEYDEDHVTVEYARVDVAGTPGYFTLRGTANPTTATIDLTRWNSSGLFSNVRSFARANSYTSGGVEIQTTASEKEIYLFRSGTALKWYSEADTVYLPATTDMFNGLDDIVSVNLTGLDASHTTDMSALFEGCTSLTVVTWGDIDTSNVTSMSNMFNGCSSLTNFSLNGLDLSSLTSMQNMFTGCSSLETLNLSVNHTDSISDMYNMFSGCESLASLDLSAFTFAGMTNSYYFGEMFTDCINLERIYVASGTDWSSIDVDGEDAFQNTYNLTGAKGSKNSIVDSVCGNYERSRYGRIDTAVWIENFDGTYTLESGNPGYFTLRGSTPTAIYYQVMVNTATNGTIMVGNATGNSKAHSGDTVTISVTPDSGYVLKRLSVTDTSSAAVSLSYSSGGYTFTMPASAVTVSVEFVATSSVNQPAADSSPSDWFTSNDVVRLSSNVDTSDAITVGSGKTLIIDSGVTVDARGGVTIDNGGVVNNYGTFNTYNNMTNNGTFNNYSGHTLNNYGTIINNGEIVNGDGESHDGRINNYDDAVIENNGTIINNEGSVINNDGEIEGNAIEGDGDVNGVENAGTDSSTGPDPDEDGMPQSDPAVLPESTSEPDDTTSDSNRNGEESSEEESETEEESSEEESSGEED